MKKLFTIMLSLIMLNEAGAQIDLQITTKVWEAFWINVPNEPDQDYGVYNFRKEINVIDKPAKFVVHISADNRYKFFVNGKLASLGPARGDLFHWNFETVDIAPFLEKGKNVLAAVVWNFGDQRPEAQVSWRTAFILQGNTSSESIVNTNKSWKCTRDNSYQPLTPQLLYTYYVSGPGERVDFNLRETGWLTNSFDDSRWKNANELFHGLPKGVFSWTNGWMLVPRKIPAMELTADESFVVRKADGIDISKDFPAKGMPLNVPSNSKVTILLDAQRLTNAYPVLEFSKGKDAIVSLSYAEALYIKENNNDWRSQKQKGNRNEIDGKRFVGVRDEIISSGRDHQQFSTLWWRAFRYVQLEIETKEQPITLDHLSVISTGYPFHYNASFDAGDRTLSKILDVGWRTARLCAVETYMDCPYYEQLQYVGDTRIQALVSLFNSGDDKLVRNAIEQIHFSRMAEGITLSRFPSANPQQIPTFCLWYIGMVHDYWMYRGDEEFVKDKLLSIRSILHFFEQYQGKDGLVANAPYWEFTDWAEGNGWNSGVAPVGKSGTSAPVDLMLCIAYQTAAKLENQLGLKEIAGLYHDRAAVLKKSIVDNYWSENKKLFADTREKQQYSQHTNTLAILAEVVINDEAKSLMSQILHDKTLTQATIYFKYYVHRALSKCGMGDQYLDLLGDWNNQLENGLTTWAEISDDNNARSDCHAWGASPNIEFFRIVLGIDTDSPGFKTVRIKPSLGKLKSAQGSVPHPFGNIEVDYSFVGDKLNAEITLPATLNGTFVWKGKEHPLSPGRNQFNGL